MKRVICRMVLIAAIVLLAAMGSRAMAEESLPDGVKGFSGRVRGVVTAKGEKNTFTIKVARVLEVWKNSKAKAPESLVGLSVRVGPRWVPGKNSKWRPVEIHIAFIKRLKVGEELTIEIRNAEADHFNILELSGEQRESAMDGIEESLSEESRKDEDIRKMQALVKELRGEIRRLRAENAELRKKLEGVEGKRKE